MKKRLLSLALGTMMVLSTLAGCGSKDGGSAAVNTKPEEQGKVLNIYCWNDEFKSRFEGYYKNVPSDVKVNWVITPNENNAYQNALDAALLKQKDAAADDKIDMFLIEADYALKYVNSDYTLDVKDVGLTDDDLKDMYQYTKDIATDSKGKLKATTWQATPGLFAYRRSIAKDVLGTDDPDKVQEALSTWDKFDKVAEQAAAKGYKMLSGYDDSYRVFSNNVSAPWVDSNNKIVIDDNIMKWVDQTKKYTDKGYNNKSSLWDSTWAADQGPSGKVFGFFYSTWGINFTLLGNFAYRRSIAKDVLGTDDPDKVQEALSTWDKFDKVAEQAAAKGYKMLSGYDDSYRVFSNNVSAPWVDSNNKIVIDDNIMKWVDQTKKYTDKGYNNKSSLWDSTWAADQGPSGKVFGFFYSTWGINFTLLGNSLATPVKEGGKEEVGNGIYGDYAVCEGPQSYYWGGTWICAAAGTDNANLVKDVMKTLCCDKATMKKITEDTQDYTNTTSGMNEIASSNFKSDFLGGQNHIKLFAKSAPKISMKNISSYDQGLNEEFQKAMKDYFDGNVTKDKALDNFYKAAIEKYPNLSK